MTHPADIPIVIHKWTDRWGQQWNYFYRVDNHIKMEGVRIKRNWRGMLDIVECYRSGTTYGTWYMYWDDGTLMKQEQMPYPRRRKYFIAERQSDDLLQYVIYPDYQPDFWVQHIPR